MYRSGFCSGITVHLEIVMEILDYKKQNNVLNERLSKKYTRSFGNMCNRISKIAPQALSNCRFFFAKNSVVRKNVCQFMVEILVPQVCSTRFSLNPLLIFTLMT